ncbi:MAG: DUF4349 domain-containing protein, partial [Oscillospiraceae bacterium]|nr:DUF4349 domain-containing protein [Oscillospiraceae bacterium]
MKKSTRLLAIVLVILLITAQVGCGGSNKDSGASAAPAAAEEAYHSSYSASADAAYYDDADYEWAEEPAQGLGAANARVESGKDAANMSEKIIYNADITLETTTFDDALEAVAALVTDMGGYLQSSSVSGSNYTSISRGKEGARTASFTIRVPASRFNDLTGSISALGNVPYSNTYTRNVTTEYYDVQSRLNAYKVQETRLLEMLSIAETVEDMLAIQRELTNVQYEIDSCTGTLRYYDNQVGYSTVSLNVYEVREYTPEPTITLTYWERMSKGFRESVNGTVNFFKEFFLWFVTSLPWMIPLALFVFIAVVLWRRHAAK